MTEPTTPTPSRRASDHDIQLLTDRVAQLEGKVDALLLPVESIKTILEAATGAFRVLEFLGKLAKPVLWLTGVVGSLSYYIAKYHPPK